jgi:hypothetical protein
MRGGAAQVSDDGHLLVVYGPHVGISNTGKVGMYDRGGQAASSTACGAACGALTIAAKAGTESTSRFDEQMEYIIEHLKPKEVQDRIQAAKDPQVELAYVMYVWGAAHRASAACRVWVRNTCA